MAVLLSACAGQADMPTVTTDEVTAITYNSATVNATVTDDGGAPIEARGVCYSTSPQPSLDNGTCTSNDRGTGSFSAAIENLDTGQVYYTRAYATHSEGTGYGNDIQLQLLGGDEIFNPNLTYGTLIDLEGNDYATIVIGTQEWMAENLRVCKYANGDMIPNITDDEQWDGLATATGAWCHYDNDSQYENPYGKIYNAAAVADSRGVCPAGWHVPTHAEWCVLEKYLDPMAKDSADPSIGPRSFVAGGKLKSTGSQHWYSPNSGATNESGFSALPGGGRFYQPNGFVGLTGSGGWWTSSTPNGPIDPGFINHVGSRGLFSNNGEIWLNWNVSNKIGASIRCIKD